MTVYIIIFIILYISAFVIMSNCLKLDLSMRTITVIGSNGKTGKKIVYLALKKGFNVNAVSRTGIFEEEETTLKGKLKVIKADVTDLTCSVELNTVFKDSQAVFFAASASKSGGNPKQIDRDGLITIAKVCIENKVPRLVIVSSGAVTKPFSPVYLFLNIFGGIMKAKIDGENAVRKLYSVLSPENNNIGYTIVRPGGLTEEEPLGCEFLELNQGDDKSGRISRWDVANICLESINFIDANRSTFECYNKDTAQSLANVGLNNLFKRTNKNDIIKSTGKEKLGNNWNEIFKGLASDL